MLLQRGAFHGKPGKEKRKDQEKGVSCLDQNSKHTPSPRVSNSLLSAVKKKILGGWSGLGVFSQKKRLQPGECVKRCGNGKRTHVYNYVHLAWIRVRKKNARLGGRSRRGLPILWV